MSDYLDLNRAKWDQRAVAHAASPGYGIDRLLGSPDELSTIVAFDRELLGDISGAEALHLQCHIGTDTLSLSRLGARLTGVDLSPASLEQARRLAERAGALIDYVEADVYHAPEALAGRSFDLVYTGIGALCWLPSIDSWAQTVSALLRPGGRLFIREYHPVLWSLDESVVPGLHIGYPYFEQTEPMVWDESTTYVETDYVITATRTHEWNHGLGEIVTALLGHGLSLTGLVEHRSVPSEFLPGQMTRDERGEWHLTEHDERLPCSYTLQAVKR